jgi:hypothetical protein
MRNQENDEIYEAAYEDFYDLYHNSNSFILLVDELLSLEGFEPIDGDIRLQLIFHMLWKNDCELLVSNKRTAVEACIMYRKSIKVFQR